jgi:hypothetical protein
MFHKPDEWTRACPDDLYAIKRQNSGRRFDARQVLYIARRCSFGFPQVIVCSPLSAQGSPFPTLFWLTCPFLCRKCGELESGRKARELEDLFRTVPDGVEKWHHDYAALREDILKSYVSEGEANACCQPERGVGGIDWKRAPYAVKCLHLQVATWLGFGHPAAEWLEREVKDLGCAGGDCSVGQ